MKTRTTAFAASFFFLITLNSPAQRTIYTAPLGNLIVNGDFESGFTGWVGTYGLLTPANYPINPGPLSGITVGVVDGAEPPMRQTISTVIGATYEIDFGMRLPDLGPNGVPIDGDSDVNPAFLNLMCNNQNVGQLLVLNRSTWINYTFDFTAQSTSSELEFSIPEYLPFSGGVLERSDSAFIDNVSVVAVPEPSAAAFSIAFILLAGMRQVVSSRRLRKAPHGGN